MSNQSNESNIISEKLKKVEELKEVGIELTEEIMKK